MALRTPVMLPQLVQIQAIVVIVVAVGELDTARARPRRLGRDPALCEELECAEDGRVPIVPPIARTSPGIDGDVRAASEKHHFYAMSRRCAVEPQFFFSM